MVKRYSEDWPLDEETKAWAASQKMEPMQADETQHETESVQASSSDDKLKRLQSWHPDEIQKQATLKAEVEGEAIEMKGLEKMMAANKKLKEACEALSVALEDYGEQRKLYLERHERLVDYILSPDLNYVDELLDDKVDAQKFLVKCGASIVRHLAKDYVPSLLASDVVNMHYRDYGPKDAPKKSALLFEDAVFNFVMSEWSEGSPLWLKSKWADGGKFRINDYFKNGGAGLGWDKISNGIKSEVRRALWNLHVVNPIAGVMKTVHPFSTSKLAKDIAIPHPQAKMLRLLSQSVEIGPEHQTLLPLSQYVDERDGVRLQLKHKSLELVAELRSYADRFTEMAKTLVPYVTSMLAVHHLVPVMATGTVERTGVDRDLPDYTIRDEKKGWKRYEEAIKQKNKDWKEVDAKVDSIKDAFEDILKQLRGLLEDPSASFLQLVRKICTQNRFWDYDHPRYGGYGPNLFRGNVEQLRVIARLHGDGEFAGLACTMVVIAWAGASQQEDLTGWVGLTELALRCLVTEGVEADLEGAGFSTQVDAGMDRFNIARQLFPTFYGGIWSMILNRTNVKISKDADIQQRCKMVFFLTTMAGQRCPMCGNVNSGLPGGDRMSVKLDINKVASTYNYCSCKGCAHYDPTKHTDARYCPEKSFFCLAVIAGWYPHPQIYAMYAMTSFTAHTNEKHLRKAMASMRGVVGRKFEERYMEGSQEVVLADIEDDIRWDQEGLEGYEQEGHDEGVPDSGYAADDYADDFEASQAAYTEEEEMDEEVIRVTRRKGKGKAPATQLSTGAMSGTSSIPQASMMAAKAKYQQEKERQRKIR